MQASKEKTLDSLQADLLEIVQRREQQRHQGFEFGLNKAIQQLANIVSWHSHVLKREDDYVMRRTSV